LKLSALYSGNIFAIKKEKVIIINVHATPNTQPGGVHGALLSERYQSAFTALAVNNPPIANAAKLIIRNSINLIV
jgi:hypothetical protein